MKHCVTRLTGVHSKVSWTSNCHRHSEEAFGGFCWLHSFGRFCLPYFWARLSTLCGFTGFVVDNRTLMEINADTFRQLIWRQNITNESNYFSLSAICSIFVLCLTVFTIKKTKFQSTVANPDSFETKTLTLVWRYEFLLVCFHDPVNCTKYINING